MSQAENLTEMLRSTTGFSALGQSLLRISFFIKARFFFFLLNFVCVFAFRNTKVILLVLQTGFEGVTAGFSGKSKFHSNYKHLLQKERTENLPDLLRKTVKAWSCPARVSCELALGWHHFLRISQGAQCLITPPDADLGFWTSPTPAADIWAEGARSLLRVRVPLDGKLTSVKHLLRLYK